MLTGTNARSDTDRGLLQALVCPVTKNPLEYDAANREMISPMAGLAFPIRNDVPILLLQEARRLQGD